MGQIFRQLVKERSPLKSLQHAMLRKNGTVTLLECHGTPIVDEKGVFKGYRGVDRAITEDKQ